MVMLRVTATAFLVAVLALLNQGVARAANLEPQLAAESSTLDSLPSLVLFRDDVLIVTQTTIEEPAPCPLLWASRALGRFFQGPCCTDLQEQAKAQHRLDHMKAVADTLGTMIPAGLRPKSVDVRDIAQKWLQQEAKEDGEAPKAAVQETADSIDAV